MNYCLSINITTMHLNDMHFSHRACCGILIASLIICGYALDVYLKKNMDRQTSFKLNNGHTDGNNSTKFNVDEGKQNKGQKKKMATKMKKVTKRDEKGDKKENE